MNGCPAGARKRVARNYRPCKAARRALVTRFDVGRLKRPCYSLCRFFLLKSARNYTKQLSLPLLCNRSPARADVFTRNVIKKGKRANPNAAEDRAAFARNGGSRRRVLSPRYPIHFLSSANYGNRRRRAQKSRTLDNAAACALLIAISSRRRAGIRVSRALTSRPADNPSLKLHRAA